jgi:hypothetical protein
MPRPVCATCALEMRPEKNGFFIAETDADGEPCAIWAGDAYRCDGCVALVVTSYGNRPVAERGQPEFAAKLEAHRPLRVAR